jgi:ABC-2 type transport system permease protein
MLVQLTIFATAFVGLGIIADLKSGVLERMQVTPVSRIALLSGRVLHAVVFLIGQCVLLLLAGLVFGLRAPIGGMVLSVLMMAISGVATTALSYAIALKVRNELVLSPLFNVVVVPLPLVSGVLLPLTLAPGWLKHLSELIPFSYLVDAGRQAFLGNYASHQVWQGMVVATGSALLAFGIGARVFRNVSR